MFQKNQKENLDSKKGKSKKIGIFLGCEPKGGGTFQYNLSIIDAAISLGSEEKLEIIFFTVHKEWLKHIPEEYEVILCSRTLIEKIISVLLRQLIRNDERWRSLAMRLNSVGSVIDSNDCSIVIYPSQDSLSYLTKSPSLATIHDLMHRYEPHFEEYTYKEIKRRDRHYSLTCKYSEMVLVDSKVGENHVLESYNIPQKKVKILPFVPPTYLLNESPTDIRNEYDIKKPYFFYPAQFWEHKNHIRLLHAFSLVVNQGYNIELVLVGSKKNNYQKVKKEILLLGLEERVHILGYVRNESMASLYKNSLGTVFVSLLGPTNIPPMESLVLRTPLICSNVYGMPDQVRDAALLIDPRSINDIRDKMLIILEDKAQVQKLIINGDKVVNSYNQTTFNYTLSQCLKEILND